MSRAREPSFGESALEVPSSNKGDHNPARGRPWSCDHAARFLSAVLFVVCVSSSCGTGEDAVARAPDEVRDLIAQVETTPAQPSYRFSYQPISALFMACLSGVEDIDVVVDADARAVRFESRQRTGAIYSLDGFVLIDRALLDGTQLQTRFAAVDLGPAPLPETLARLDAALGTALANQLAAGGWPTHPKDVVAALVSTASSISLTEPQSRTIRIVLDPDRYADKVGSPTAQSSAGPPPIVEATVNEDGSVDRIAVRLADPDDPGLVPAESDGYALDFDYSTAATVEVPDVSDRTGLAWDRLPQQPSDVPCLVEP